MAVEGEAHVEADSSLGAYDPYRKNVYRGVHLAEDDYHKNRVSERAVGSFCLCFNECHSQIESVAMGEIIEFRKKRKAAVAEAVDGSCGAADKAAMEIKLESVPQESDRAVVAANSRHSVDL